MKKITITDSEAGERLDAYLSKKIRSYSRNYFIKLIRDKQITVNQKAIKPSHVLKIGDSVEINFVEEKNIEQPKGEPIPLDIIYEDTNVIAINKQPGLVVHPAAGNYDGTLVNALIDHFPEIEKSVVKEGNLISLQRAGIVHRLDKDTSGIMVVAKNSKTLHSLSKQIKDRAVQKCYLALCYGWLKDEKGTLINFLGRHPKNRKIITDIGKEKGKEAISDYKVLGYFTYNGKEKFSLVEFDIKTGRTHQIRAQASMIGHPIIGDSTYGNKLSKSISLKLKANRQLLHAKTLAITIPGERKQRVFSAPLPEDFLKVINSLKEIS